MVFGNHLPKKSSDLKSKTPQSKILFVPPEQFITQLYKNTATNERQIAHIF